MTTPARVDGIPTDRLLNGKLDDEAERAWKYCDELAGKYLEQLAIAENLAICLALRVPETARDEILKLLDIIGSPGASGAAARVRWFLR